MQNSERFNQILTILRYGKPKRIGAMTMDDGKEKLTDAIKASVTESGILSNLKNVSHDDASLNDSLHELKQLLSDKIEDIQKLLNSGKLDDSAAQKLSSAVGKFRSVLGKDAASRAALAAALSEATTTLSSSEGDGKGTAQQQIVAQLWKNIEADNKDIDDDFTKMKKAGIVFNESLLDRHRQLMENLQAHPRDLKTQKELDAVDDALLMQAEPQIKNCPEAKPSFDDATKKSKDRHKLVDKDLVAATKGTDLVATNKADDWDMDAAQQKQAAPREFSMNDVAPQSVGQRQQPAGKQLR